MGWETRRGKRYYYRKKRIGGRVVSEYAGAGEIAELGARLDAIERAEREDARAAIRRERQEIAEQDRLARELGDLAQALARAALLAGGAHTHKGQWRKRKKRDGQGGKASPGLESES